MARGELELSFVTKITSPKNLLKALAGAIFGVALALLGMSRPTMRAEPLAAHLLALAWAAHAIVLQRTGAAQRWWGAEVVGSFPRWRNMLMMPLAAAAFPACLYGMANQTTRWAAGGSFWHWLFVDLLFLYLLLDIAWVPRMGPVMLAHHVVCLVVHALESFVFVAGFELYLAGVVVIELGSAACNVHTLYPRSRAALALYVVGMTASNLGTLPFVFRWFALEPTPPLLARIIGALSVPGMLGSRQLVALKVWRASAARSKDR